MSKAIFITATSTDAGKTYAAALIAKKLRENNLNAGYYKAALSGGDSVKNSDAGYVNEFAEIGEEEQMMVSYLYKNAVSPHLAAKMENNPVMMSKIKQDFQKAASFYDYLIVEGSGGIVCPIRYDGNEKILLEDVIKALKLKTIIVAPAGLGSINSVVTTAEYMKHHEIPTKGIILNHWVGDEMQQDNLYMIEQITNLPVLAKVCDNQKNLDIEINSLKNIFEDI